MKLAIRADANDIIATGHVMRCIAIAQAARRRQISVVFITCEAKAVDLIKRYDFDCCLINGNYTDMDKEIVQLLEIINQLNITHLCIDSYYVSESYLLAIFGHVKTIYIDDLNLFDYPVHALLNYNLYHGKFNYKGRYANTKLLMGSKYALLREEFTTIEPILIKPKVQDILITTGGTDRFNIVGELLALQKDNDFFDNMRLHIVVGKYFTYQRLLIEYADSNKNIILHTDVHNMAKLMLSCDIAISAGGSTPYELCACGVPFICVSFADNQLDVVSEFAKHGIKYAGDIRNNKRDCLCKLIEYTKNLCYDLQCRIDLSNLIHGFVDGHGADRIISFLTNLT